MTGDPSATPSSVNCTDETPMLSAAAAAMVTLPWTVDEATGEVSDAVGGVVSGIARVVAFIAEDWAELFPAASKAETVNA